MTDDKQYERKNNMYMVVMGSLIATAGALLVWSMVSRPEPVAITEPMRPFMTLCLTNGRASEGRCAREYELYTAMPDESHDFLMTCYTNKQATTRMSWCIDNWKVLNR